MIIPPTVKEIKLEIISKIPFEVREGMQSKGVLKRSMRAPVWTLKLFSAR